MTPTKDKIKELEKWLRIRCFVRVIYTQKISSKTIIKIGVAKTSDPNIRACK